VTWLASAWFVVADAPSLPVRDAGFDVAAGGPVLNFLPAQGPAVAETATGDGAAPPKHDLLPYRADTVAAER